MDNVTAVGGAALAGPAAPAALEAHSLSVRYGDRVAVAEVSFAVARGEIYGLLGPNGAGKSSLMRCLTGLCAPAGGHLSLHGSPLPTSLRAPRRQIGVVFQEPSLDVHLTARENLVLGAALFGVARGEAMRRADALLAFMALAERADERVRYFSGGMRRRLELARALIHRPSVLLLDEPTQGLDPGAFARTWERLLALRETRGLAIVLTTHRADEAARCDRLAVMDGGLLVAEDTPAGLLAAVDTDVVALRVADPAAAAAQLRQATGVAAAVVGDEVVVRAAAGHLLLPRLIEALGHGAVQAATLRRPSLDDAFFGLTGRGLAATPAAGAQAA